VFITLVEYGKEPINHCGNMAADLEQIGNNMIIKRDTIAKNTFLVLYSFLNTIEEVKNVSFKNHLISWSDWMMSSISGAIIVVSIVFL